MIRETDRISFLLSRVERFARAGNVCLRPYQEEAIQAVWNSVQRQRGLAFSWIFPRQAGKDEALAITVQFLLTRFQYEGAEIVVFNPTFKPQTETSMRRLQNRLDSNILTIGKWAHRSGYIYQVGKAYCTFLSADPSAHVVSATANRLLVVNEAQDVGILKYDKDIAPMAASTHATRLFVGTRWTANTLLEREYQIGLEEQKKDGIKRVFFNTADDVRKVCEPYGRYVDEAVARLGRQHPLVKTQYFCETVDAQAGMFPPGRQALMHGSHAARTEPEPGKVYAFLVDVAGQAEEGAGEWERARAQRRDSTFLKIVEVDLETVDTLGKPTYRVVYRQAWTGASHVKVFGALKALTEAWDPQHLVIDATGVGEGLWSLLDGAYGAQRIMPVKFTAPLKSELGYGFLGLIESGRYLEYHPFDETLRAQLEHCRAEILPGPGKHMRWGVPDGTLWKGTTGGDGYVHDDDLITGAMCTLLDRMEWRGGRYVMMDAIPHAWWPDPDEEMRKIK